MGTVPPGAGQIALTDIIDRDRILFLIAGVFAEPAVVGEGVGRLLETAD